MSSHWESLLTPQEVHAYAQFFSAANGSKSTVVSGPEAVAFFARSGIPNEILSDIWETADRDNLGYLTPETFSIALKLVACAQHGHEVAEPILSSAVPLPQFEGFNPDATTSPNSRNDIISPAEREKYLGIFRAHQPVQGVLDAEKVKNIFDKSKLPNEYLAQIWNLADLRKAGNLNQTEFVIAMHYIAKLMDRSITTLPAQLPAQIYGSAAGSIQSSPVMRRTSMSPAAMMQQRQLTGSSVSSIPPPPPRTQRSRTESIESLGSMAFSGNNSASSSGWDVTPQEKSQYDIFFNQIDTKRIGAVHGNEAVEFFKNSRLPDTDLARVWDLADLEQNGQLTRDEFAVAMHLIQSRLAGNPLPNVLPRSLIPPSTTVAVDRITSPQQPLYQSPPPTTRAPSQPLAPPPPQQPEAAQEDLLGDFGDNEELTTETNAVNQLQYQIKNVQSTTAQTKSQKAGVLSILEQSRKQKENVEAQTAQLASAQQAEGQRLIELQNTMQSEESEWTRVQREHDTAQKELEEIQLEVARMAQTLDHGRTESERLRHQVHDVQQETAGLVGLLERLRIHVNKQRSVDSTSAVAAAPSEPSSKLTFDDVFSPSAAPARVASPATSVTPNTEDDFDTIFAPQPTTAEKRQPPPPPPPSRRTTVRRQEAPQTTKKARAPPPPPPSATAAVVATVAATAATAAALESDESGTETTTSSDTESASEDAKSLKTESPTAPTAPKPPTTLEPSATNDQDTKSLEQSAERETVDKSNDTATETTFEEQTRSLEKPQDSKVDELADDEVAESDAKKTQSLQESAESEAASMPVKEEQRKTDSSDEVSDGVSESEANATPDNAGKESTPTEEDHHVFIDSGQTAPATLSNVEAGTIDASTANQSVEEGKEPSSQLTVELPKEEDRKTSEILADQLTPSLDQSTTSSTVVDLKQNLTEAKPQEAQEEASLQDRNEKEIATPVSSSSSQIDVKDIHTSETQVDQPEANTKVAHESHDPATDPVSTSKEGTAEVNNNNDSKLFAETQDEPEQRAFTDAPIPVENEADTEIARGEDTNDESIVKEAAGPVAAVAAAPVIEGMTVLSKETEDSTDDDVSTKQGELKNEATTGVEGQGLDTGVQEGGPVGEGDNTQTKDKDTESDIEDEFLSIDGDDANQDMDADDDRKTMDNDSTNAKDSGLHDGKENKPMDEQTEPRMKHNQDKGEEEKALVVDKERAVSTSSSTKSEEEGGERGSVDDAHYVGGDLITSKDERLPEEEISTHDSGTPKNFAGSVLMTSEPKEHVEEGSPSKSKEPEQGLSTHGDSTANEEEQRKEQPANEDFDAVFMERPNDTERSSSDEGGGESFEIISSTTSPNKDHQALPAADEFDAAFASELQQAKVVNDSSLLNQDDFDAAFADELTDAKVVHNNKSDSEKGATTQGDKLSWASNFGGFNFEDFDSKKKDDEWDSIFGGDESKAGGTEHVGFQDAFSASFNNSNHHDNASSSSNNNNNNKNININSSNNSKNEQGTTVAATEEEEEERSNKEPQQERGIPTVGSSNLDQLVIMGFDRDLAKEALDRYDQDLEKATNFLLDLAAK
ncbi:hypothetical protein BDB00DRAFT_828801 [Zychaea mexicana]|uniref:uncharacterized protein n=1 Tax=Zychaea mexicana TaxID=64656 RepID=UPI0022FE61AF|nr:uncharacterized protein BDB00DRAFT_828801 [Zychaea mexicana]KAI9492390.1 hypothetical protein BDB00DRAFT_828801 [Zychaea mexicana]